MPRVARIGRGSKKISMKSIFPYGPAMSRLSEQQQRFVLAMCSDPFGSASGWAKRAGYVANGVGIRVRGYHLVHDERIQEASLECARALMGTAGPVIAANVMLKIAANSKHPKQLRAAEMIANRVGMHEVRELVVTRVDESFEAKVERIKAVAALLGVDVGDLVGRNVSHETKVIEHEQQDESVGKEAAAKVEGPGVSADGGASTSGSVVE